MFLGPPVANHRPLDLRGAVLDHRHTRFDRCQDRHAPRVSKPERALDVGGKKQILDRHAVRLEPAEQYGETPVNGEQPLGEGCRRRTGNGAALNQSMMEAVGIDATVTGALRARIDPEHLHASEASISFSEMSKFDQTCCTSSWSSSASISRSICCATLPSSLT